MKKIILFILLTLSLNVFSQTYYQKEWTSIEEKLKTGKIKSVLPQVVELQNQALKENNLAQLLKSLSVEYTIISATEHDEKNDLSSSFFNKLQTTNKALKGDKAILFRLFANKFLTDYYWQNQWKINRRTSGQIGDFTNIETWTRLEFKNRLTKNFHALENQKAILQKYTLKEFPDVFDSKMYNLDLLKTFWEWYANDYVKFLNNTSFFTSNELKENQTKIEHLLGDVIHSSTNNTRLYFEYQILKFSDNFSSPEKKDEALQNLINEYFTNSKADYVLVLIGNFVDDLKHKNKLNDALELIAKARKRYPKSPYLSLLINREKQYKASFLELNYDSENQSNQPIYLSVEYKNLQTLGLKIYKIKDEVDYLKYIDNSDDSSLEKLKKTFITKKEYSLPNKNDFLLHTTTLAIPFLPTGIYLVEYKADGKIKGNFHFIVSNHKILFHINDISARIVNNGTGKPYSNEDFNLVEIQSPNIVKSKYLKTDAEGYFTIPINKGKISSENLLLKAKDGSLINIIRLGSYNWGWQKKKYFEEPKRIRTQLFFDRGIYRPGQVLYFKGIVTKVEAGKESIVTGRKQQVSLYDEVNDKKIGSLTVYTNEFGSYHGSFTLPNRINGTYSVRYADGQKNFLVEDYQPPKFEVVFEPIKGQYQFGQTIQLKGRAVAFSGASLGNVKVQYEIKKNNLNPFYFEWFPPANHRENSILGNVTADDNGYFTIDVQLEKDSSIKGIQVQGYTVNASVTDINGETQSNCTTFKIASIGHYFDVEIPENTFSNKEQKASVKVKNYNGEMLDKAYNYRVWKLSSPKRLYRNKFKNHVQDAPSMGKEEFIKNFPHDYYNQAEKDSTSQGEEIVLQEINKKGEPLNLGHLPAGSYRLEIYNIEGEDTIRAKKNFNVWNPHSLAPSQKPILKVLTDDETNEQSEKAHFYIYSALPNPVIRVLIQDGMGSTKKQDIVLKNGAGQYAIDTASEKSDKLKITFQTVAFNEVFTKDILLSIVPNDNPLKIETETFRDHLEPHQKEKWTLRIKGSEKEKISAEVLASMYDLSLDQFVPHQWTWSKISKPMHFTNYAIRNTLETKYYFENLTSDYLPNTVKALPDFSWFNGCGTLFSSNLRGSKISGIDNRLSRKIQQSPMQVSLALKELPELAMLEDVNTISKVHVRESLTPTAFFYPTLSTNAKGEVSFEFIAPDQLTKWKFMVLAHTKDLRVSTLEKEVVTQKKFFVTPNYPRFVREGDVVYLKTKISSLLDKAIAGEATLQILDAYTNEDITNQFGKSIFKNSFHLKAQSSDVINWEIKIPSGISSIIFRIVAQSENFSDGEQKAVAVLSNKQLVMDALPIFVKPEETQTFQLEALKNNSSTTLKNVATTLELTTSPVWETFLALPSLIEQQSTSAEVVFNQWMAEVLAMKLVETYPQLKATVSEYQSKGLLKSKIVQNESLKQLQLEETPWLLESQNETEQMQKLAGLFDLNAMQNSVQNNLNAFLKLQNTDGGFSWYQGNSSSYVISLYILKNWGKLKAIITTDENENTSSNEAIQRLIKYVDTNFKNNFDVKKDPIISNHVFNYLDSRKYWEKEFPLPSYETLVKSKFISDVKNTSLQTFTFYGLQRAALLLDDYGLKKEAGKILTYLKETSTSTKDQGVYWKSNIDYWGWYHSKIVNHAGALEVFEKLKPSDTEFINELKIWLLTRKQVGSWGTSRNTAEVIFALLQSENKWTNLHANQAVINWGGKKIIPTVKSTGYVKKTIPSAALDKNLSIVHISNPTSSIVQGGLYWQYYEDLSKVFSSNSSLSVEKKLYRKIKTLNGEELQPITTSTPLKIGEKVTVRMTINSDRDMEFVQIKDLRAAGFEPLDVISGYRWKYNLGYYQSTKDASTNFFIDSMPKGKYVLEYDVICRLAGQYSNGMTTIQNYYVPQMNAHSSSSEVNIE